MHDYVLAGRSKVKIIDTVNKYSKERKKEGM